MKLVEKKCPNCGAGLEFSDTDKSCKCNYCHRAFEIEREQDSSNEIDYENQFILNEVSKGFKFIPIFFIIVFIVAFAIIGFVIYNIYKSSLNDEFKTDFVVSNNNNNEDKVLYSDANQLTNSDLESIDNDRHTVIKSTAEGVNNAYHSYIEDGDPKRQKVYVAYKTDSNYIIAIYQNTFKDFFHQENRYTFYIPIVYENIYKEKFGDKFENPQLKAPEYYFNDDHSSFSYGYGSLDDAYNNVVKSLIDQGYTVTEK